MSSALADLKAQRRLQSEEELLEYQERFKQGSIAPSTKVVRAVRKKTDTNTNNDGSSSSIGASIDATPVAAVHEATPTSSDSATSAGAAAEDDQDPSSLVFPTGPTITENRTVAAPRATFAQSSAAAQRTGFPAPFKIRHSAPNAAAHNTSAASNNPQPRAYNAPVDESKQPTKKKSLFAQQRDRMLQKQREMAEAAGDPPATTVTPSQPSSAPTPIREVVQLSSTLLPNVSVPAPTPAPAPAAAPSASRLPEAAGIDAENDLKLSTMSIDEIEHEQRELERMLPPELVRMLRARRNGGGAPSSSSSMPPPSSSSSQYRDYPTPQQLDEDLLADDDEHQSDSDDRESDEDDQGMDENGIRVERLKERLASDQQLESYSNTLAAQAPKLEWSSPITPSAPVQWPTSVQDYHNDGDVWNSFRVDLEGRFIGDRSLKTVTEEDEKKETHTSASTKTATGVTVEEDYDDPYNALYHHGDQADRPGYTMRELLHLVRSTIMSQRTLSLQVLGRVLQKIRNNQYDYPAPVKPTPRGQQSAATLLEEGGKDGATAGQIPPFAHLLFSHLLYLNFATLLRLALDDNRNTAGILAAVRCLETLLTFPTLIRQVEHSRQVWQGYLETNTYQQRPSVVGELEKKKKSTKDDKKVDGEGNSKDDSIESGKEDQDVQDNTTDESLCSQDLIVGMTRMKLFDRLRYILEVWVLPSVEFRSGAMRPIETAPTHTNTAHTSNSSITLIDSTSGLVFLEPILHILLGCSHSHLDIRTRLVETQRLREILFKILRGLGKIVAEGREEKKSIPLTSLTQSLHVGMLLLTSFAQLHRDLAGSCLNFATEMKRFIVLVNGVPGLPATQQHEIDEKELEILLPIATDTLHLWRVSLAYGLDCESFLDHFPVLLGIISKMRSVIHANNTHTLPASDTTTPTPPTNPSLTIRLGRLSHLSTTIQVLEGFLLLFKPQPTFSSGRALSTTSPPPHDLSFEFGHLVGVVDQLLKELNGMMEFPFEQCETSTYEGITMVVSSSLHMIASYYTILPDQGSFERGLYEIQVEKHLNTMFQSIDTKSTMRATCERIANGSGASASASVSSSLLRFDNLPSPIPVVSSSVLHSLDLWFGLLRWHRALLPKVPIGTDGRPTRLTAIQANILASTTHARHTIIEHFFHATPSMNGTNRLHDRNVLLTPIESQLVYLLLELSRFDISHTAAAAAADGVVVDPAVVTSSLRILYGNSLTLVPSLLRCGQQYLVRRLFEDVLFNPDVLIGIEHDAASNRLQLTPSTCAMLKEMYTHFACQIPEEDLISEALDQFHILTPTLCRPVVGMSNVIAHVELTLPRYCVKGRISGSWLLSPLKHNRFLQVQLTKRLTQRTTKLSLVCDVVRFLLIVDGALECFTPPPPPVPTSSSTSMIQAHAASSLFLRAVMELYLLGSDIFLTDEFAQLIEPILNKLFDSSLDLGRTYVYEGVPNHALSTLIFGASITPLQGNETMKSQGEQLVELTNGTGGSVQAATNASSGIQPPIPSSSPLSSLKPFYDLHSSSTIPISIWGQSFYPFFKEFVSIFLSDSMGDTNMTRMLTLFLRMDYSTDYRLVLWRDTADVLAGAGDIPLPLDIDGCLFPYETNSEVIQMMIQSLTGIPVRLTCDRNPALYRIAIHHVAIHLFGWPHVSGASEMSAGERVKRVQDMMPMTLAPETTKDLHDYRFKAKRAIKAAGELAPTNRKDEDDSSISPPTIAPIAPSPAPSDSSSSSQPTSVDIRSLIPSNLTPARLAEIAATRAAARSRPPPVKDPNGIYGLICPCCTKPNSDATVTCTGCSFELVAADFGRLPDNIFLAIVTGADSARGNKVHYRGVGKDGREYLIIEDKFGTSTNHLDCIPAEVFKDITVLTREHITMVETLYQLGLEELSQRPLPWLPRDRPIEDFITAGFNAPVSVFHLHLHMVLGPYFHDRIFTYPRWHSYAKVLTDLRTHGRVILYHQQPNEEEGKHVYQRALRIKAELEPLKAEWEAKEKEKEKAKQSSSH